MKTTSIWLKMVVLFAIWVKESDEITIYQIRKVVSLTREEQMDTLEEYHRKCQMKILAQGNATDDDSFCPMVWDNVMCWDRTEGGTVAKQRCPDYVNGLSSAGTATRECLENGSWKPNPDYNNTNGWTDFAACIGGKPKTSDLTNHLSRIQLMSEIGYGISLASLVIAVLIMFLSKRLHCKSNSLHINLFLAFILRASVSFLQNMLFVEGVGLEKDIIRLPNGAIEFNHEGSHWECKLLMTLLVYTVAASLMWIFMEGLYLHMLVYRTLFTERNGIKFYVFLGWLTPLVYIIPWVCVRIYVDNNYCWTNYSPNGYFWIIKGPILLTIVINFVFFIGIVRVLCKRVRTLRNVQGTGHQFRKLAKFAVVLIPLFGVIYIGFAAYPEGISIESDIVFLYCEMFYNSFQGFILALLFCFLNEEVQNEIRRCLSRRRHDNFNTRSFIMSSWRKSSMSRAQNCNNMVESVSLRSSGIKDRNENPVKYSSRHGNGRVEDKKPNIRANYKLIDDTDTSPVTFSSEIA